MSVCFRTILCFLALFGVVACGGGGSLERDGGTGGGGVAVTIGIQLAVTDNEGQVSTDLTSTNPLTLSATVSDSNGNLLTDTLVTFSFQPTGLATFSNDAGTASTGADGIAILAWWWPTVLALERSLQPSAQVKRQPLPSPLVALRSKMNSLHLWNYLPVLFNWHQVVRTK